LIATHVRLTYETEEPTMLEESFLKIANRAPVMLWMSDTAKNFVYFNDPWLKFRGCTLQEELNHGWEQGVHEDDLSKVKKQFDKSFAKKEPYKIEYRLQNHKGQYRWIIDNGVPQFSDDNQFSGYIGSCFDIHEIKELEHRKEEFITAASHELKTPVTSLNVYLHLIDEYFTDNKIEKYGAYSKGATMQLNKINTLIEELLDLSRIQSGSLNYSWSEFSFCDMVSNIIEKMQLLHPNRQIDFSGECDGQIRGDVERLSQAIENLISNALKYSSSDNKIRIDISEDKNWVMLSVTDYGIGIATEHLSKIFKRFYRIPGKLEATYPGMGMGLYLSQKIINKHNGSISVESRENEYTKFIIKIPILKKK